MQVVSCSVGNTRVEAIVKRACPVGMERRPMCAAIAPVEWSGLQAQCCLWFLDDRRPVCSPSPLFQHIRQFEFPILCICILRKRYFVVRSSFNMLCLLFQTCYRCFYVSSHMGINERDFTSGLIALPLCYCSLFQESRFSRTTRCSWGGNWSLNRTRAPVCSEDKILFSLLHKCEFKANLEAHRSSILLTV